MNLDSDTTALREGMENFNYRIVFVDFFLYFFIIYFYEAKKPQKHTRRVLQILF
jgi:hypothetical protein